MVRGKIGVNRKNAGDASGVTLGQKLGNLSKNFVFDFYKKCT